MLKKKYINGNEVLPPDMPDSIGTDRVPFGEQQAANDGSIGRSMNHARRMRRHGRAARANVRRARGWSVGMW